MTETDSEPSFTDQPSNNAIAGWWWADPVAALLMVPWLIHEGIEGFEEEGCCGHD